MAGMEPQWYYEWLRRQNSWITSTDKLPWLYDYDWAYELKRMELEPSIMPSPSFSIYGPEGILVSAKEPTLKITDKRIGVATKLGNIVPGNWFYFAGEIYFIPKVSSHVATAGYTNVARVTSGGSFISLTNDVTVEPVEVELVVTQPGTEGRV